MSKALYRKYRSRSLDEVVGQRHITDTLQQAVDSGKISHAYLFTGPRGVGKTSVARILAHLINELDYQHDELHLDIIEIDAASNRRIDEIRDLRDKVHIAPTSSKYKVYIIDEVHMLTKEAFNALLKTLEEPPAHCVFILATTELHKVPATIISRTQRFNFQPISKEEAIKHLKDLAQKEKIKITASAVEIIAEYGQGSLRDSISLLEQLASQQSEVNDQVVANMIGIPPTELTAQLLAAIIAGQSKQALEIISQYRLQGYRANLCAQELSKQIRQRALESQASEPLIELWANLLEVPGNPSPEDYLEIVVLKACGYQAETKQVLAERPSDSSAGQIKPVEEPSNELPQEIENPEETEPQVVEEININEAQLISDKFNWPELLSKVKKAAPALYTALRLAEAQFTNQVLHLSFEFPLHQKKINETKNKQALIEIFQQASLDIADIKTKVEKTSTKAVLTEVIHNEPTRLPANNDQLTAISNIFGSAEVLES